MLQLASDTDVHGDILRGLHRHSPEIDLVRVQDTLPEGTPDPAVLAWAVDENRVLISHPDTFSPIVGIMTIRVAGAEP